MTNRDGVVLWAIGEDKWRVWRDLRLQALTEAPYAFGSKLAEWQGKPDNEKRWRGRLQRMWVAPFARGRGLGDSLVAAVIRWASSERAQRVVLCVVDANIHATALYARHGFEEDGFVEDAPSETGAERRMVRSL